MVSPSDKDDFSLFGKRKGRQRSNGLKTADGLKGLPVFRKRRERGCKKEGTILRPVMIREDSAPDFIG
jgi:hypothetical protein